MATHHDPSFPIASTSSSSSSSSSSARQIRSSYSARQKEVLFVPTLPRRRSIFFKPTKPRRAAPRTIVSYIQTVYEEFILPFQLVLDQRAKIQDQAIEWQERRVEQEEGKERLRVKMKEREAEVGRRWVQRALEGEPTGWDAQETIKMDSDEASNGYEAEDEAGTATLGGRPGPGHSQSQSQSQMSSYISPSFRPKIFESSLGYTNSVNPTPSLCDLRRNSYRSNTSISSLPNPHLVSNRPPEPGMSRRHPPNAETSMPTSTNALPEQIAINSPHLVTAQVATAQSFATLTDSSAVRSVSAAAVTTGAPPPNPFPHPSRTIATSFQDLLPYLQAGMQPSLSHLSSGPSPGASTTPFNHLASPMPDTTPSPVASTPARAVSSPLITTNSTRSSSQPSVPAFDSTTRSFSGFPSFQSLISLASTFTPSQVGIPRTIPSDSSQPDDQSAWVQPHLPNQPMSSSSAKVTSDLVSASSRPPLHASSSQLRPSSFEPLSYEPSQNKSPFPPPSPNRSPTSPFLHSTYHDSSRPLPLRPKPSPNPSVSLPLSPSAFSPLPLSRAGTHRPQMAIDLIPSTSSRDASSAVSSVSPAPDSIVRDNLLPRPSPQSDSDGGGGSSHGGGLTNESGLETQSQHLVPIPVLRKNVGHFPSLNEIRTGRLDPTVLVSSTESEEQENGWNGRTPVRHGKAKETRTTAGVIASAGGGKTKLGKPSPLGMRIGGSGNGHSGSAIVGGVGARGKKRTGAKVSTEGAVAQSDPNQSGKSLVEEMMEGVEAAGEDQTLGIRKQVGHKTTSKDAREMPLHSSPTFLAHQPTPKRRPSLTTTSTLR